MSYVTGSLELSPSPVRGSRGDRSATFRRYARGAAVLSTAVGGAVLVGWLLDIHALKRVFPGLATMKANTALCFLLLGTSLFLLADESGRSWRARLAGRCMAALTASVGIVTIAEQAFAWDLGIDQALFRDLQTAGLSPFPGRMSMATAADFVMLGSALLLLDRPRWTWAARLLAYGAGLVSGLAVAGYLYGVSGLYAIPGFGSVALHTALTLATLSMGILCARSDRGLMKIVVSDSAAGVMARRLLPGALLVPLVLGWLRLWGQRKGYYGTEFGLALFACSNVVVFVFLISWSARTLHQMEAARWRATEALRGNEERLHLMVTNMPAALAMLDRNMRYLMVSPRWMTDYGLGDRDISGLSHYDVFPGMPERWKEILRRCMEGSVEKSDEDSFTGPNGTLEWVRWEIHPWNDNRGGIGGIIIFSEVITARKRAEEALAKTEDKLRQAQKMEAVGRLAGGVAHDFNNLLTAILGFTELTLARVGKSDPAYGDLMEVFKAGERASGLTRQLLAFGRQQILQLRVLDLNASVTDIAKMLKRLIGEDIELIMKLTPGLGRVNADPGQIEQVIMNLAVNARDAMPEGGELIIETADTELDEIYLKAHPWAKPGPYVMLAVTDTGTAMSEEVKAHLFEPFFTTKEVGKGTGLGLATVYGIVKQSGGQISVYSEVGSGTSFKIYLPRVEGVPEAKAAPMAPKTTKGTETILLVEDEAAVRALAGAVLKNNGYTVLEASNGLEGLEAADRHGGAIHLAVTDIVMPKLSGQDFASRLGRHRPEIKILFMSGYTDAAVHQRVIAPGIPFLQKPFTGDHLLKRVREVLDSASQ